MFTRFAWLASFVFVAAAAAGCGDSSAGNEDAALDGGVDDGGTDGEIDGTPVEYQGAVGDVTYMGPWGGAATHIAEDPVDATRLYAVVGGAVFRSEDHGQTWQDCNLGQTAYGLITLPDGRVLTGTAMDIEISDDHCDTWQNFRYNMETGYTFGLQIRGLAYQSGSPGRIWAGLGFYGTAPIWTIEDGQTTWTTWNEPTGWSTDPLNGEARFSSIDTRVDGGTGETLIFATFFQAFGAGGGVFCSTDSGTTWAQCSTGLPQVPFHRVRIYNDYVVIAGGQIFGSAYAGIWYSDNHGVSWTQSNGGWVNPIANDFVRLPSGGFMAATYGRGILETAALTGNWTQAGFDGMEVNTLIRRGSEDLLAGPEQLGIYESSDGGGTWLQTSEGLDMAVITDACVNPQAANTLLAPMSAQNSGLVLHTASGINGWAAVDTLPHPRFSFVMIGQSGRWYVVSDGPTTVSNDGVLVSTDNGSTFNFIGPLDGNLMDHDIVGVIERDGGQTLIVGGRYWSVGDWSPFVSESTDGGANWTELWRGGQNHTPQRIVETRSGDVFMGIMEEDIIHIDPSGQPHVITVTGVVDNWVTDVAACYEDGAVLYAVGRSDSQTFESGAFASADGGGTWSEMTFTRDQGEQPRQVAVHPYDCELVFLGTSTGRLLHSEDSGANWQELNLPHDVRIQRLRVIRLSGSNDAVMLITGLGGILAVDLTTTVIPL